MHKHYLALEINSCHFDDTNILWYGTKKLPCEHNPVGVVEVGSNSSEFLFYANFNQFHCLDYFFISCCRVFKLPKGFCFLLLCACSTGDGTEGGHGGANHNIRKALPGRPERNHLNPWPERQARERAGHQGLTLPTGTPTLNQACADLKFI